MLTKSKPGKLVAGFRILAIISFMLPALVLMSFQSQGKDVKGFVVNKYGKHLAGAVIEASGNNKVTSDAMGHFVIKNVPENTAIKISAENYITQNVSPVVNLEMVIRMEVNMPFDEMKKKIADYLPAEGSNPLIVINGAAEEKLSMADIDPANKVASLKIFRGDEAIKRFGEKAKNGAVEIITEPNAVTKQAPFPPADSPEFKEKTLVLIDGNVYNGDIKDISMEGVKSMTVDKYTPEYDKYGLKGKEKVILFITK